jgi:FkbM family methyltransferase
MNEQQLQQAMLTYQGPSYSEKRQDVMVCCALGQRQRGYFVEFGALDGKTASNSMLFERYYDWQGIVAEPNQRFHGEIASVRSCRIDHRAVYSCSGQGLEFKAVGQHQGLSTLTEYVDNDKYAVIRRNSPGEVYNVKTVSLMDLLTEHRAPRHIDYISMDTEGSELDILAAFDFSKFDVKIWTIEHNFTPARERIHDIMQQNNYRRVLSNMSSYDDWYIQRHLLQE